MSLNNLDNLDNLDKLSMPDNKLNNKLDNKFGDYLDKYLDKKNPNYSVIREQREQAYNFFNKIGMPSRKLERWKYTDLSRKFYNKKIVYDINIDSVSLDLDKIENLGIYSEQTNQKSIKLFFKDGFWLDKILDKNLIPEGLEITHNSDINNINDNLNYSGINYLGELDNKNPEPMAALNKALAFCGISIKVDPGFKCDQVIEIIYLKSDKYNNNNLTENLNNELLVKNYRHNILLGSNSSLKIAEASLCVLEDDLEKSNNLECLNNIINNIELGESADLDYLHYTKSGVSSESTVHAININQNKDSVFKAFNADFSCGLNRFDINVLLAQSGARCQLNGVYTLSETAHSDHHVKVMHKAGNTTSDQCYFGVLGDKSVGVFNGELIAEKHTKNIDAHQLNKNLLLDKGAVIYTKPELRIETDDIKCSHGASIGELDDMSLFYLLSRGISLESAKLMLMQAFLMTPVLCSDFDCWNEFLVGLLTQSIRSHFWCEDSLE